jgi:hypothetical protein
MLSGGENAMYARTDVRLALALGIVGVAAVTSAMAGQLTRSHAYVAMVADVHRDAPEDMGLLPAAIAEAKGAAVFAKQAAASTDLAAIKLFTGHVLNAVDARQFPDGPGLAFGVKRAAQDSADTIEMAAKTEAASANIKTHAVHVAASARNTVVRADKIVALGKQIGVATAVREDSKLAAQIVTLTEQLISGVDANGDGQIGWQENEGGLSQALQHLTLLKKGENLH